MLVDRVTKKLLLTSACQHVSLRHLGVGILLTVTCIYLFTGFGLHFNGRARGNFLDDPSRVDGSVEMARQLLFRSGVTTPSPGQRNQTGQATGAIRAQRIKQICDLLKPKMQPATNAKSPYYYIMADDKYKTLYCAVSKCGSTSWKNALIKARTGGGAPANMAIHTREYLQKHQLVFLNEMKEDEVQYRLKNYYKYAIVRHPLDRMVSTYRDKFLGEGEAYFKNVLARSIKAKRKHTVGETAEHKDRDIEFPEFVEYVLGRDPLTWDRHWLGIYNHCHPCHIQYDFIAHVETLDTDAPDLFKAMKMPHQELLHINTHSNSTTANKFAQFYDNIQIKDYKRLLDFYFNDLLLFGYSEPTFGGYS